MIYMRQSIKKLKKKKLVENEQVQDEIEENKRSHKRKQWLHPMNQKRDISVNLKRKHLRTEVGYII